MFSEITFGDVYLILAIIILLAVAMLAAAFPVLAGVVAAVGGLTAILIVALAPRAGR